MQHVSRGINRVLRSAAPDGVVPYERLRAAEDSARACFPDALRVVAVWTPANEYDVAVEVWTSAGGRRERAQVFPANALEVTSC